MNPSQASNLFMNQFLMWSRLAWRTGEIAVASAKVIGHRTNRLALAGPVPSASDQREFALMGREKGEAALESAQAVCVRMLTLNQQLAALAFKQMLSASAGLLSLASSRTAAESVDRQATLVRETMARSTVAASKLSGSAVRLARSAAKPVHARVKRNARGIGKKSR